ncbi:hypothetical protein PIROE2DRAFT_8329, partial [Piromyces sp. E2]
NILIDSGSGKSFLCKNFTTANNIPTSGLSSPISIQLPNGKSMIIKQTFKPLILKFMDHTENFEFSRRYKFLSQHSNISAPMVEEESSTTDVTPDTTNTATDSIIPIESISDDDLIEDICCALINNSEKAKQETNNEETIKKYYSDLKIVFEKKEADKLPPHRKYNIAIELIPGGQLYFGPTYL